VEAKEKVQCETAERPDKARRDIEKAQEEFHLYAEKRAERFLRSTLDTRK